MEGTQNQRTETGLVVDTEDAATTVVAAVAVTVAAADNMTDTLAMEEGGFKGVF